MKLSKKMFEMHKCSKCPMLRKVDEGHYLCPFNGCIAKVTVKK